MGLCHCCQSFDIRTLLKESEAQELRETPDNPGLKNYRDPIPLFFKLQPSLRALRESADNNKCRLCQVLLETSKKTLGIGNDLTDSILDNSSGELFIGASRWKVDRQGFPYITLTQIVPSGGSNIVLS